MGGRTAEHEISVGSGRKVIEHLDLSKYNVKPVTITREGLWRIPQGYLTEGAPVAKLMESDFAYDTAGKEIVPIGIGTALDRTVSEKVDVVFIAMHGPYGEDGTIQGLLEVLDIPYTGSGVEASAISMNKVRCKQIYIHHGIPTPRYEVIEERAWKVESAQLTDQVDKSLGFPCVTKPPQLGSSVAIRIVQAREDFGAAIEEALRYDNSVLVEEFMPGRELTSPILGNEPAGEPTALPLVEIVPKTSSYFDYEAKYTPGASDEITPARVDEEITKKAQELGVMAHKALGCAGLSRTDMILNDGELSVLETNTIPGLTDVSLFPKAANAMGMSFSQLLDHLIEVAVETHRSKKICTDR
jgi:D-alanine-D-alanine ligase